MATENGIASRYSFEDYIRWMQEQNEARSDANVHVPLQGIAVPLATDVLYGKGGLTNQHPGNRNYLEMAKEEKQPYVNGPKWVKELIVRDIVRTLRAQEPPVRFLKKDDMTGLWYDVGDEEFAKKVKRALGGKLNNRSPAPQEQPQVAPIGSAAVLQLEANESAMLPVNIALASMSPPPTAPTTSSYTHEVPPSLAVPLTCAHLDLRDPQAPFPNVCIGREDVLTQVDDAPLSLASSPNVPFVAAQLLGETDVGMPLFAECLPFAESSSTSQTEEEEEELPSILDTVYVLECSEVEEPSHSKMDESAPDLHHLNIDNGHFCNEIIAWEESCKQSSLDSDDWAYAAWALAVSDCDMSNEELESMSNATATIPSNYVACASDEPSSTTTTTPNGQPSNNELPNIAVKSPPFAAALSTSSHSSTTDISGFLARGEESSFSGSLFPSPSAHADNDTEFFWSDQSQGNHSNNNNIAVDMMQHSTSVAKHHAMKRVTSHENEADENSRFWKGPSVKPAALDRHECDGASPTVKRQPPGVVDLSRKVSVTNYCCGVAPTPAALAFVAALNGTDSSCHDEDRAMQELAQTLERSRMEETEEVNEFVVVSTETFNSETTMSVEYAVDPLRLLPLLSRTNSAESLETASSDCMSTSITSWDLDDELECVYRHFLNKNAE